MGVAGGFAYRAIEFVGSERAVVACQARMPFGSSHGRFELLKQMVKRQAIDQDAFRAVDKGKSVHARQPHFLRPWLWAIEILSS